MTLLHFFFIISGTIIFIITLDIARKQRFNALHFLVFLAVSVSLFQFSFFPKSLDSFGKIFGVARGADVLVYISVIFLLYFVLLLLSKHLNTNENLTQVIREIAIKEADKKEISGKEVILIRAYNEEKVIKGVLEELLEAGYKNILVVNDGSTDKTLEILESFRKKINIVSHFVNRGAGAALQTGFEYLKRFSKAKYIITFDADGQHSVSDIKNFIEKFEENPEVGVIFGSRFLVKQKNKIPFFRKITLMLGRIFTFIISGILLSDAHNGLRGFRSETLEKINLKIDSMAYASELIDEIRKNKVKYLEIPVTINYTTYSLSKGQSSLNAINIAFRMIYNKLFK